MFPRTDALPWSDAFLRSILKCSRVPRHVGFIMDGNRRFARQIGLDVLKAHRQGFDKMLQATQWSLELGVHVVTFYLLNTHNLKRTPEEVKAIFDLLREKFRKMIDENDAFEKQGLRVNFIGCRNYLPEDLQELVEQIEFRTKDYKNAVLNMALLYSGQEDIVKSVNGALQGLRENKIKSDDISVDLMSRLLDTSDLASPEMVIRTGGDARLSDFLLWQASFSHLFFLKHYWPEFSRRDFLWAVFKYQRQCQTKDGRGTRE